MATKRKKKFSKARSYARFRARLLRVLGMRPEYSDRADDRVAASTGELLRWARTDRNARGWMSLRQKQSKSESKR